MSRGCVVFYIPPQKVNLKFDPPEIVRKSVLGKELRRSRISIYYIYIILINLLLVDYSSLSCRMWWISVEFSSLALLPLDSPYMACLSWLGSITLDF